MKASLKAIIREGIEEEQLNLIEVKDRLENVFNKALSLVDEAYIERKYIKYCSELWLKEVALVIANNSNNMDTIQDIFNMFGKIANLNDVPGLFKRMFYRILMVHCNLLRGDDVKTLVYRFEKECCKEIMIRNECLEVELTFLKTLLAFFNNSQDMQVVIVELELRNIGNGETTFSEFVKKILQLKVEFIDVGTINAKILKDLQDAANCLRHVDEPVLIHTFRDVIKNYIKPADVVEKEEDGRLILEIIGNVVVSEILNNIEGKLLGNNIEEVRFIAADIIRIDKGLQNEVWHGKNVVVLTNNIKVCKKVIWDVSGSDNNRSYGGNAGTGKDGNGEQGQDGFPGESGGNVLVLAETIENPEYLTIISNGGKGSKGQDGGNGKDGENGKGITRGEFFQKFPSCVKFTKYRPERRKLVQNTINYIKSIARLESEWYENKETNAAGDVFIEANTNQGNKIIFSYYTPAFRIQAFLLYTGSFGTKGGSSGDYGLGGQGGYSGIITACDFSGSEFNIAKHASTGEDGKNGQEGLYGKHGKNGWDMGYSDYQLWGDTRYYGTNEESKLSLVYTESENTSESIYCSYIKKYALIESRSIEHKREMTYNERRNTRENNDRKHYSQATRKKNIPQSSLLSKYTDRSAYLNNTLQSLKENHQKILQVFAEIQTQQKIQIGELKVKRYTSYNNQFKRNNNTTITHDSKFIKKTVNIERLINQLIGSTTIENNWFELKHLELDLSQINMLILLFQTLSKQFTNPQAIARNIDIENLLIRKYRLAKFQEIARTLLVEKPVQNDVELTAENAVKYLMERETESYISHPILGTLNQYLTQNNATLRENILKYWEEEIKEKQYFIRAFILEFGKGQDVHSSIKNYFREYQEFLNKHTERLNIYFAALNSEISQARHNKIYELWTQFISDTTLRSKLEKSIESDLHLKGLYNRFNNEFHQEYSWDACCEDQTVLKEYKLYIRNNDTLSVTYREFLAYVFDVNIRLYKEDKYYKLYLEYNHNPQSKQTTHILCGDNKFIQMCINMESFKLHEDYKQKAKIYSQVIIETDTFKRKQMFDDYLKTKTYLCSKKMDERKISFYNKLLTTEEEDINKILEYFPNENGKQQEIEKRLKKMSTVYIGEHSILYNILERYSIEGNSLSSQELFYVINLVLSAVTEDEIPLDIFSWIVAAHPQRNWINELILLQLEMYFKKSLPNISEWRWYLSKIENKGTLLLFGIKLDKNNLCSISVDSISDTLYLLSSVSNKKVNLEELHLSEWFFALKEQYWLDRLSQLTNWQGNENMKTASYYLLSIDNVFGTDLVSDFLSALAKKQHLTPNIITNILSSFYNETWNLNKEELRKLHKYDVTDWTQKMDQKFTSDTKDRDISQLVDIIKSNANTSQNISDNLTKISKDILAVSNLTDNKSFRESFTEYDIKRWMKKISKFQLSFHVTEVTQILTVIDRAIEIKRGFRLRDSQKLAILALFTNDRTLAQVSTGEGKSLIVVAASIMRAIRGQKVHILTSSPVLAKRDAEGNKDIYGLFNINVSHNCYERLDKRKAVYSGNQVIYGDLGHFQRDYLLDTFYDQKILGHHKFENIIIDEVDSMLLDKGNNMLYLSHDIAGLDKLESIYVYIWQWINRPVADEKQFSMAFNAKAIKEAVLYDLYGIIKKEDLGELDVKLNEQQKLSIFECLIKKKILDVQGKLLKTNINKEELEDIFATGFESCKTDSYKDRLHFFLKEIADRDKFIHVPNYLKPLIEQHLESWINSAITAYFMESGQDYVVDVDKTETSTDRSPNITILDRDTGTDQANSQWNEALHQFLQLKHGCKLSLQTLKAVFISNVSFFKLYRHLYGLTGTLGLKGERDLLKEIHNVDFVTIPTSKCRKFEEYKPIICASKEEWIGNVCREVNKLISKRSVLVICETVRDVETLYKAFGGKHAQHVHTYTRDYEDFDIVQGTKELEQGQIIIATNLAGRGTDIKISKEMKETQGLHVCLTYLPNNIRIEHQAFGRAARNGEKGSGQLIIFSREKGNLNILNLKKDRDAEELHRIFSIKTYYDNQISVEEKCFIMFKRTYKQLENEFDVNKIPTEIKKIVLKSCLDKWALWLDENNMYISNITNSKCEKHIYNLLNNFIIEIKNINIKNYKKKDTFIRSICNILNPAQKIKIGIYLSQEKQYSNAIDLFNEVINKEPAFSEAAHYYKAFAISKWKTLNEDEIINTFENELRITAGILENHSMYNMNYASIISKIKKGNDKGIIQIDAYEEQKNKIANIYYMFSQSVENILGNSITPKNFMNQDINNYLADTIFEDLLRKGALKKPTVKERISEDDVTLVSNLYGISTADLKQFLYTYKGKEIVNDVFLQALKKSILLPSREAFWKCLLKEQVLSEEVIFVSVDNEKLEEIDPSLYNLLNEKINNKIIEKHTLKHKYEVIFLYTERVTELNKMKAKYNTFKKIDLINIVGKDKYAALKKKDVFLTNKKAHIAKRNNISIRFPHFDSITLEDFSKINISKSEAENCLNDLVKLDIIQKNNYGYNLKIKYQEIECVSLSFCSVYNNAIKSLLANCFAYRNAFELLVKQIESKNSSSCIKLTSKPHQCIFWELLERRIIEPIKVATETNTIKNILKSELYNRIMSKNEIVMMLHQSGLISVYRAVEIFDDLKDKGWIYNYWFGKILPTGYYCIDGSKINKISLSSSHKDIEKTLKSIFENRLIFEKEDTINYITTTLDQANVLKNLTSPDCELNPINDLCGSEFGNTEEEQMFFLNGLCHFLKLIEKKWTWAMLGKTALVTVMGLTQIAAGAIIELYSLGTMTHVASGCISEGVSDILFAIGALRSGYFSWKSYGYHKLQSVMTTALTVGIGAYLSRGTKVSRLGYKLVGPNLEITTMCGKELMDNVGKNVIKKEIYKRIALKAAEGVSLGIANAGVDMLVNNYLNTFCQGIATNVLSNIEKKIDDHKVCNKLEKVYKILGKEKAKTTISQISRKEFNKKSKLEEFVPIATNIADSIIQGATQATKKMNKVGTNKLVLPINAITKTITWSKRSAHLISINEATDNFLNEFNQKLDEKISKFKKQDSNDTTNNEVDDFDPINKAEEPVHKKQDEADDYATFKMDVINEWKFLLREKVGNIIETQIVTPILQKCSHKLIRYAGKLIQEKFQAYNERKLFDNFKKTKEEHNKTIQNLEGGDTRINDITKTYHETLLKLLSETKNTKLFADIIRENIPMDMTCVKACAEVLPVLLGQHVTIIVTGDSMVRQSISSSSEVTGHIIQLHLSDNHFSIHGGNDLNNSNTSIASNNNCLYEALSEQIGLNMTPESFREEIAKCIELHPKLQYHISQGWHGLPISLGAVGGARKDIISINKLNEILEKLAPYQHSVRGGWEFKEQKDRDLRKQGPLSNEDVHSQITEGFKTALDKVNQAFKNSFDSMKSICVDRFSVTKYDTVLGCLSNGKIGPMGFPVEMETKVNVYIKELKKYATYTVKIDIDNPSGYLDLQGPHGPHVGYEIKSPKGAPKLFSGHILLNQNTLLPDRGRSYNANYINSNIPNIPLTRLFSQTTRPNSYLERFDVGQKKDNIKEETRGKRYPKPDY